MSVVGFTSLPLQLETGAYKLTGDTGMQISSAAGLSTSTRTLVTPNGSIFSTTITPTLSFSLGGRRRVKITSRRTQRDFAEVIRELAVLAAFGYPAVYL